MYSVLLKTIESWTRSLLAAVLNAPDPGLLPRVGVGVSSSVADSPQPWMSFGIAVAAAGIAGVVLAPLDIIRTRYAHLCIPTRNISNRCRRPSLFTVNLPKAVRF